MISQSEKIYIANSLTLLSGVPIKCNVNEIPLQLIETSHASLIFAVYSRASSLVCHFLWQRHAFSEIIEPRVRSRFCCHSSPNSGSRDCLKKAVTTSCTNIFSQFTLIKFYFSLSRCIFN